MTKIGQRCDGQQLADFRYWPYLIVQALRHFGFDSKDAREKAYQPCRSIYPEIEKTLNQSLDFEKILPLDRSLVFVGLMGVGKSTVGRRVAHLLGLPFADADNEIEAAAGRSIKEIFSDFGEVSFRDGEKKVIKRLLEGQQIVLATGGGAFADPETRQLIRETGISVWLKADIATLVERVSRNENRPLLAEGEAEKTLKSLAKKRSGFYKTADLSLNTDASNLNETAQSVIDLLDRSCISKWRTDASISTGFKS